MLNRMAHDRSLSPTIQIIAATRLCVVERGAVGRLGRILVPWGYWGEDSAF